MELYRRNGAQLAWLLLPAEQAVELWRGGTGDAGAETLAQPLERIEAAQTLDAGDIFPGLQIDLSEIWQG
jgi:Uma2 family endonuclease